MEKRYAILIGINNYADKPLDYTENDCKELKECLINYCDFASSDIHTIVSTDESNISDITGEYKQALRLIKDNFNENEDLILFYFSGHGQSHFGYSNLLFHSICQPIDEVYSDLMELKPKNQIYIIDACESGNRINFKGEKKANSKKDAYLLTSSGVFFAFACQAFEEAMESSAIRHGLLTSTIIETFKNPKKYNDENILSLPMLQDCILKKVTNSSRFTQNPVVVCNLTGYYPLAQFKETTKKEELVRTKINIEEIEKLDFDFSRQNRLLVQKHFIEISEKKLNQISNDVLLDKDYTEYDIRSLSNHNLNLTSLEKELVIGSTRFNLESLNDLLYSVTEENKPADFGPYNNLFSNMLNFFPPRKSYSTNYYINDEQNYTEVRIKVYETNNKYKNNIGLGKFLYQAKWGLVAAIFYFDLEWDGETNSIFKLKSIEFQPFTLDKENGSIFQSFLDSHTDKLNEILIKSNNERKKEFESFIKRSNRVN